MECNCTGDHLCSQIHWLASDSDDSEDMEADEEDGASDVLPSVEDVLDKSTWRRKRRLHKQKSNVSLHVAVVTQGKGKVYCLCVVYTFVSFSYDNIY